MSKDELTAMIKSLKGELEAAKVFGSTGSATAFTNLQPHITVYTWKHTA